MGRALGVCVEGEEIDAARLTERLDERVLRASRVADAGPLDGPLASPKPPTE
jgi:hypothetical protein